MGAWGKEPWDNDEAADWFGELWEEFPIADTVLRGLDSDSGETLRAAVWLCSELCRVYVWPIERYDDTLDRAIAAADRLLAREDEDGLLDLWGEPEVEASVQQCRDVLAQRRAAGGSS